MFLQQCNVKLLSNVKLLKNFIKKLFSETFRRKLQVDKILEKLNNKQINKQNSKEKKNLNFKSIEENKSPIENAPMISVPKNPFAPRTP